jgi:class 3 adenylate cyclase
MAVAMQRRIRELQSEWREAGLENPFQLRIGISTGFCTVGNFGSEDRLDYTIHGSPVNLASRLQSHGEPGSVLLSHETHSLVKDAVETEEQQPFHAKGFADPVRNYKVIEQSGQTMEQTSVIRREEPGMRIFLDLRKLDKAGAAQILRSMLSRVEQ